MPASTHPSHFELDLLALGSAASTATTAHLVGCSTCGGHVARIAEAEPLPAAIRRLIAEAERRPPPRVAWAWIGAGAVALAALLLLVVVAPGRDRPSAPAELPYTTVKGGQAVAVYLKRGARTLLWNGVDAIEPGDRVQLKVVPDGLSHVEVFTEIEEGGQRSLVSLYQGSVSADREAILPVAWQVDQRGAEEVLIVLLASAPVSPERARAAIASLERGDTVWVTRLVLPKRSGDLPP